MKSGNSELTTPVIEQPEQPMLDPRFRFPNDEETGIV